MTTAERYQQALSADDADIDLAEAALLIASDEYPELDIPSYVARLDGMAGALKRRLRPDISATDTVLALNHFLFKEMGFAGNREDYYDPRNSYLNEVLDRRRGIPITLSLVYLELGRRVGLKVDGVSFPAHFLVKCTVRDGAVVLDPYESGASLGYDELKRRAQAARNGAAPSPSDIAGMLAASGKREILARLLRNLKAIYMNRRLWDKALKIADRIVVTLPRAAAEIRDRGLIYIELECFQAALRDLEAYRGMAPDAPDAQRIRNILVELRARASTLN